MSTRFDLKVIAAKNLPKLDGGAAPNPYVKATLNNDASTEQKTSISDATINPKFTELFKFKNINDVNSAKVTLEVWSHDIISDVKLGEATVSLSSLTQGEVKDTWLPLQKCSAQAEVRLRMCIIAAGNDLLGSISASNSAATSPNAAAAAKSGPSAEKLARLRASFAMWDVDGSGALDRSELSACLLHHYPSISAAQIVKKIRETDVNGDGLVDFDEYKRLALSFDDN